MDETRAVYSMAQEKTTRDLSEENRYPDQESNPAILRIRSGNEYIGAFGHIHKYGSSKDVHRSHKKVSHTLPGFKKWSSRTFTPGVELLFELVVHVESKSQDWSEIWRRFKYWNYSVIIQQRFADGPEAD